MLIGGSRGKGGSKTVDCFSPSRIEARAAAALSREPSNAADTARAALLPASRSSTGGRMSPDFVARNSFLRDLRSLVTVMSTRCWSRAREYRINVSWRNARTGRAAFCRDARLISSDHHSDVVRRSIR
jgi:hypothetical protein